MPTNRTATIFSLLGHIMTTFLASPTRGLTLSNRQPLATLISSSPTATHRVTPGQRRRASSSPFTSFSVSFRCAHNTDRRDAGETILDLKLDQQSSARKAPKRRDVLGRIFFESASLSGMVMALVGRSSVVDAASVSSSPPPGIGAVPTFHQLLQLQPDSTDLPNGLLEARVTENVLSPPPYGMETADVYYPSWFQGIWSVKSTTTNVEAPCGIALFGGNTTYQRACNEIGTSLQYTSRFVPIQIDDTTVTATATSSADASALRCIADREYNVRSIAQAAMGTNSVVDIGIATPNQFACTLSPQGSPTWLNVDLMTTNRRQEYVSEYQFDCSEVVRELVRPIMPPNNAAATDTTSSTTPSSPRILLKEVETTSLYKYNPNNSNRIECQQRSASFLVPSPNDPLSYQLWQLSQGKPIDVRMYNVVYERQRQ